MEQLIVVAIVLVIGMYLCAESTVFRIKDPNFEPYLWLDMSALVDCGLVILFLRVVDFITWDWWLALAPVVGSIIIQLLYTGLMFGGLKLYEKLADNKETYE